MLVVAQSLNALCSVYVSVRLSKKKKIFCESHLPDDAFLSCEFCKCVLQPCFHRGCLFFFMYRAGVHTVSGISVRLIMNCDVIMPCLIFSCYHFRDVTCDSMKEIQIWITSHWEPQCLFFWTLCRTSRNTFHNAEYMLGTVRRVVYVRISNATPQKVV